MDIVKKSPWVSVFNGGGCAGCSIELKALVTPRYDIERFGCLLRSSARHADILFVTGTINRQDRNRIKKVYEQMSPNKKVIAVGSCAITGGVFHNSYNVTCGLEKTIPVDIYVPGCPPRPESIIDALLKVLRTLK